MAARDVSLGSPSLLQVNNVSLPTPDPRRHASIPPPRSPSSPHVLILRTPPAFRRPLLPRSHPCHLPPQKCSFVHPDPDPHSLAGAPSLPPPFDSTALRSPDQSPAPAVGVAPSTTMLCIRHSHRVPPPPTSRHPSSCRVSAPRPRSSARIATAAPGRPVRTTPRLRDVCACACACPLPSVTRACPYACPSRTAGPRKGARPQRAPESVELVFSRYLFEMRLTEPDLAIYHTSAVPPSTAHPLVAAPEAVSVTANSDRSPRRCAHPTDRLDNTHGQPAVPRYSNRTSPKCFPARSATSPLCIALCPCWWQPVTPSPSHLASLTLLPGRPRMASAIHRDRIFSARTAALAGLWIRPVARHQTPTRFDVPMLVTPPDSRPPPPPHARIRARTLHAVRLTTAAPSHPRTTAARRHGCMALHTLPVARFSLLVARRRTQPRDFLRSCQVGTRSPRDSDGTAWSGTLLAFCFVSPGPSRAGPPAAPGNKAGPRSRLPPRLRLRSHPRLDRPVTPSRVTSRSGSR
ncbi:hypothetical protein C8Q78DRAFT_807563 [Trametes maxima]|nr:hypothetical protein C8Q78DRAFT_807563 [Trametes maxima]